MLNRKLFLSNITLIQDICEKKQNIEVMYNCLADLSEEDFLFAIQQILKKEVTITKATNLIALIRKYAESSTKLSHQIAEEAWGEVLNEICRVGYVEGGTVNCNNLKFSNDITSKIIDRMGGWKVICNSNSDYDRLTFINIFRREMERKQTNKDIQCFQDVISFDRIKELAEKKKMIKD